MKFREQEFETAPGNVTGVTGNCETVVAQVPAIIEHIVRGFEFFFSPDRSLDPLLKELSVTRAAWARGSQFVFSQLCKVLRTVGVSEQQSSDIPGWQASNAFTGQHGSCLPTRMACRLAAGES